AVLVPPIAAKGAATERTRYQLASMLIRPAMFVEKAAHELIERRTAEILGHLSRELFGAGAGFLGHRNVHDRRQHPLDQRREALLRDGHARGLSCRGIGGPALGPDQRRQRQGCAEAETEGGGAGLLEAGGADGIRRKL